MYLHGAHKKVGAPCVGMRVFSVQRTTASHRSATIYMCQSTIQDTATIGIELSLVGTYVRAESASRAKWLYRHYTRTEQ